MNLLEELTKEAIQIVQNPSVQIGELTEQEALELFLLRNLPVIFLPQSSQSPIIYQKKFEQYIEGRKMITDSDILLSASSSEISPECSIDEDLLEGQIETRFRIALVSMLAEAKEQKKLPDFSVLRLHVWQNLRIPVEHSADAQNIYDAVASNVLAEYVSKITNELPCVVSAKRVAQELVTLRNRLETNLGQEFENNDHFMYYSVAVLLNAPELATLETSSPRELTSESLFFQSAVEQASKILSLENPDQVSALTSVLEETVQKLVNDYGPSATKKVIEKLQWSSACGECSIENIQALLRHMVDTLATEL